MTRAHAGNIQGLGQRDRQRQREQQAIAAQGTPPGAQPHAEARAARLPRVGDDPRRGLGGAGEHPRGDAARSRGCGLAGSVKATPRADRAG